MFRSDKGLTDEDQCKQKRQRNHVQTVANFCKSKMELNGRKKETMTERQNRKEVLFHFSLFSRNKQSAAGGFPPQTKALKYIIAAIQLRTSSEDLER